MAGMHVHPHATTLLPSPALVLRLVIGWVYVSDLRFSSCDLPVNHTTILKPSTATPRSKVTACMRLACFVIITHVEWQKHYIHPALHTPAIQLVPDGLFDAKRFRLT